MFQSKFTAHAIKTILKTRRGYYNMLGELVHNKNLMKLHANSIVTSVEDIAQFSGVTVKKACKFYGISKDWYYAQKQKLVCSLSPLKKCYRQYANQLTVKEVVTIEHLVKSSENKRKPLSTIYFEAMRKHNITCGITTFRKYANALGFINQKPERSKSKKGFVASYVFEWLHIGITNVHTIKDSMQKVAFVKDNFSKAILHWASVSKKADSTFITKLFKETFIKHNLNTIKEPINILTDGGPENKGAFTTWVNHFNAPPIVTKITARTVDFQLSNSMAESTHSIYKTEFLNGKISRTIKNHLDSLEKFVDYYNNERYPADLHGLHPMQVINGEIPDKDYFKQQIAEAKINRVITNKAFNKCPFVG